jgi:hypothetical protein
MEGRAALRGSGFVLIAAGVFAWVSATACIGGRPQTCTVTADCGAGSVCGTEGFCVAECQSSRDCPCGGFCATGCGLCVRFDLAGPATCFAFQEGLTTSDVLSACAGSALDASTMLLSPLPALQDGGACLQPPLTLPMCVNSPPLVDAAPTTTEGDGSTSEVSPLDAPESDAQGSSEGASTGSEAGRPEGAAVEMGDP